MRFSRIILLTFSTLLLAFQPTPATNVQLRGIVKDAATNRPLQNIYLYIIEGEEEALTNSKGEFSISTRKQLPVTLTVQDINYEKQKLTLRSANEPVVILLRKK